MDASLTTENDPAYDTNISLTGRVVNLHVDNCSLRLVWTTLRTSRKI